MKRRLLLFFAGAVVLFGAIAAWKAFNSGEEQTHNQTPRVQAERRRLTAFWKVYQDATTARIAGDFSTAAALYKKALALKPDHEDSIYYLGNCFFETGNYTQAADEYRQITRSNPRSQRAFSQLGVTLSTLAPAAPFDAAAAEASFRTSIGINSEESGPFVRLGLLALNTGDPVTALRHFRMAAGFRSPEGCFQAGSILFSQGRYGDAAAMFKEVLRMNAREKAISGRGVLSEGDIATSRKKLTPLEAAGVKSLLYLAWSQGRPGVQREQDFQVELGRHGGPAVVPLSIYDRLISRAEHAAWADSEDKDGNRDLAVSSRDGKIELYRNSGEETHRSRHPVTSGRRQRGRESCLARLWRGRLAGLARLRRKPGPPRSRHPFPEYRPRIRGCYGQSRTGRQEDHVASMRC